MAHRSTNAIFLALLSIVVLASCALGPQTVGLTPGPVASGTTGPALATFREGGLVLSYPAAWRVFHHDVVSSFSSSIAYLATVDVPDPCTTTHDYVGTTTACGDHFHLGPDTLVVEVVAAAFPGFDILRKPSTATAVTVDGLPGYFESGPPEDPVVGADQGLVWTLARPSFVDNFLEIRALVRGPDLAGLTAQLRDMISTIRYDPPVEPLPRTSAELNAALGKALGALVKTSAAWRCFPAHVGSAVGTISEYPGGPALQSPHQATCRTDVEPTELQLWRATFTVKLDKPDPVVGGQFAAQVWIAPDGTPGEMTSGSTVP